MGLNTLKAFSIYMKKTALICGISGQDGTWLAKLLLEKEYNVWGTSRDAQSNSFSNLRKFNIHQNIKLISMIPEDFRSVIVALKKSKPDEIYFLAGQSSVGLSFEQPAETIQSITLGTLNMLEACRLVDHPVHFIMRVQVNVSAILMDNLPPKKPCLNHVVRMPLPSLLLFG